MPTVFAFGDQECLEKRKEAHFVLFVFLYLYMYLKNKSHFGYFLPWPLNDVLESYSKIFPK